MACQLALNLHALKFLFFSWRLQGFSDAQYSLSHSLTQLPSYIHTLIRSTLPGIYKRRGRALLKYTTAASLRAETPGPMSHVTLLDRDRSSFRMDEVGRWVCECVLSSIYLSTSLYCTVRFTDHGLQPECIRTSASRRGKEGKE